LIANAQSVRNRVDNRGKEFRIAFLQTNGADDAPRLALDIACEKPTSGTITYLRSGRTVTIPTLQPNVANRIELEDTADLLLPDPSQTLVSRFSILVRFNEEVVIYGINTQRWSSDTFLALPTDVLGTEHVILSYPNTLDPNPAAAYTRSSDFPSQFAVVATQAGTVLSVDPSVRIKGRPDASPFTVTLNAGDVFFAQALGKAGTDLSGTVVRSSAPVVVYGSHQRANIPFDEAVGRDHLVEQLPPINRWGRRAILTPHYQIPKTVNDKNIVRIIAARDNTVLTIDSAYFTTLSARQFIELPLDGPKLLTASEPILVAQFQHSTVDERFVSQPNDSVGDPFMMLVPPQEFFDSTYWFESLLTKDFSYHFINVVIPTERIKSLVLDGAPVSASFTRIDKTSYSYAEIRVSPGFHKISARAPFGLYIYGYGVYNSYGHPGAMVFDTLFKDQKNPDIVWRDTCGGAAGAAIDDSVDYDFGMESLKLLDGSQNVHLQNDPFKPGDDSIHFRLLLDDPYQDGYAKLEAVDTAGLDRFYNFKVKGFTVAMQVGQAGPIPLDTLASLNGREFCRTITLTNYGEFEQRITGLRFSTAAPGVRVEGEFPVDIAPGGSREFSVCFEHVGDTSFAFDILADNGCLRRPVARLPVISGIDSTVPVIQPVYEPCETDRTINLREEGVLNSGVQSVTVLDSMNVDATVSPALPAKSVQLHLRRIDPFQDMIYSIRITDAVGNTAMISDTVGGFTIAVQDSNQQQVDVRVGREWNYRNLTYGEERCDTFYLRNYGLLPLALQRPRVVGNLDYSIPPEQLPIVLQPGEVRPLEICVKPRAVGEQIDTLVMDFYCGDPRELVVLRTVVDPLRGNGSDRCGDSLQFEVNGFAKRNYLEAPFPNPVSASKAQIVFGLTGPQDVTLGIYDGLGNEVRRLFDHDALPGGVVKVDANLEQLSDGMYYLRMHTSTGSTLTEKLVVSH
jgi:hypothetical protein